MHKKWLAFVLLMSFLSACGGATVPGPAPVATPSRAGACMADDWSLEFHRSGGFAGFDESLTLRSEGELTVNSNRPKTEFKRTLSLDEVQRITDQLEAACPFEPVSKPDVCADCFAYMLTVDTGGKTYRFEATDVTLTSEQSTLVGELQQYFNEP